MARPRQSPRLAALQQQAGNEKSDSDSDNNDRFVTAGAKSRDSTFRLTSPLPSTQLRSRQRARTTPANNTLVRVARQVSNAIAGGAANAQRRSSSQTSSNSVISLATGRSRYVNPFQKSRVRIQSGRQNSESDVNDTPTLPTSLLRRITNTMSNPRSSSSSAASPSAARSPTAASRDVEVLPLWELAKAVKNFSWTPFDGEDLKHLPMFFYNLDRDLAGLP